MTDFLLANRDNMNPFSPFSPIMAAYTVSKEFRKEDSSIMSIKSFDDNLSIRSSLTYNVTVSSMGVTYIKQMPFTAVLTRSIILLPEKPMRPRYADSRINIFWWRILWGNHGGRSNTLDTTCKSTKSRNKKD